MNVVREDVERLVDKELKAATDRFGLHHSYHEKYAVTLEELQECEEETKWMRTFLDDAFEYIRKNNRNAAYDNFYTVYNHAVSCAVEAIQVAAMCKKESENDA